MTIPADSVWYRDREALWRANEALEYWRGQYKLCAKPFREYLDKSAFRQPGYGVPRQGDD